jgi:hypothetical protein
LAEAIAIDACNDRAIELDLAEVQIQHVGQGGIPGAEIIDSNRVQSRELMDERQRVLTGHTALRDLDHQPSADTTTQAVEIAQLPGDGPEKHQPGADELAGQVDRQPQD